MPVTPRKLPARFTAGLAALALAGLAAACGPAPESGPSGGCSGPGGPPDATATAIFDATNATRASAGLAPLSWDPQLWCLAEAWSKNMGDSGNMYHRDLAATLNSPGFSGYNTLGENVLDGPDAMSGGSMHAAWMNSPEHRANIVAGTYASFAVATYYANGQVWATENFGG